LRNPLRHELLFVGGDFCEISKSPTLFSTGQTNSRRQRRKAGEEKEKERRGERLEKVFPGCGRERSASIDERTRPKAHGCARVGVYLYICHDLNRDNLPFSSQKIDNTYYPLIENRPLYVSLWLSPLALSPHLAPLCPSQDPSSNNPASSADVIRYSVSLLYPQHPSANRRTSIMLVVKVDGVSSIPGNPGFRPPLLRSAE